MDEKSMDTENERNYSTSCEEIEEIGDILSGNSSESSLGEKCVSEASVAKGCPLNHEDCNARSGEMKEKYCTASYGELVMDKFNAINSYREQSGYSADNSASGSSTDNTGEEKRKLQSLSFKNKRFRNELTKNSNISAGSHGKNTINTNAVDTQKSSSEEEMNKIVEKDETLRRYFDSLQLVDKNIATNQQLITQSEEEYKDKTTSLQNKVKPSSLLCSNVNPRDLSSQRESLKEDGVSSMLNPLADCTDIESPLSNIIHEMQGSQSDERFFLIANRSYNEADISDFPEILRKNDTVLTDIREAEQCPEISPIDDESVREKSLKDISEKVTWSKLPKDSESVSKNDSSLKNREVINACLNIPSTNKENHPNETEVSQKKTFKRPLSDSPTRGRESKIMKPSSSAESQTRALSNVDINLTKEPVYPDDNLSPKSHTITQAAKKH